MRSAVAAHAFPPHAAGAVTATLGVATFPHDGVDLETLWAVTERVLREARGRGGNCVETPGHRAA
jgi:GGDEF domain-containing protein